MNECAKFHSEGRPVVGVTTEEMRAKKTHTSLMSDMEKVRILKGK